MPFDKFAALPVLWRERAARGEWIAFKWNEAKYRYWASVPGDGHPSADIWMRRMRLAGYKATGPLPLP